MAVKILRSIRLAVIACLLSTMCFCQETVGPLRKGEKIPDVQLKVLLGDSTCSSNLSKYKGELLLIDFWGTSCLPCIYSLPKVNHLQKQFEGKLKVLLVTDESKEAIARLWKILAQKDKGHLYADAGRELPIVFDDTILHLLLPHTGQPTHAYFSGEQRFLVMTHGVSTNEQTVQELITGGQIDLPDAINFSPIDPSNPMTWIQDAALKEEYLKYFSFFINGIDFGYGAAGLSPTYDPVKTTIVRNPQNGMVEGVSCLNGPVIGLYRTAYQDCLSGFHLIPLNRIFLEGDSANNLRFKGKTEFYEWAKLSMYSYAIRVPPSLSSQVFSLMRKDIDKYFGLHSTIETKLVKCWVLKSAHELKHLQDSTKGDRQAYFDESDGKLILRNVKLSFLAGYYLTNMFYAKDKFVRFIDETEGGQIIDVDLPWRKSLECVSIDSVQIALKSVGFQLVEETRTLPMLVIK